VVFSLSQALGEEEGPQETSLSKIFMEEPVSLDTFIADKKYLGSDWRLSPIQADAVRHIERVYLPELYPLMAEEFGGYWADPIPMTNMITLQWGKGSGKDHICRVASLRVAYMLLCLKSPQSYYSMPEQDSIHLLNIAHNSAQANRAFFKPLVETVRRKGWFQDKAEAKQGEIQYDKNITAISGHSDAESQEGLNIMLGVADEIDAFKAKDEMVGQGKKAREASTSAESILDMLQSSASTRFPDSYKRVAISFPRYLGSTIQRLTDEGKRDNEKYKEKSVYYVSGPYATWDVNPRIRGKEQFEPQYRKDPEDSAGRYECKPSRASNSFFRNPVIFQQAVSQEEQPLTVDYEIKEHYSDITKSTVRGWEPIFNFASDFKPVQGARYALHGDLAITGDRAGIAMSHVERWLEKTDTIEAEDGELFDETTVVPVVKNDFCFGFEADIGESPPREIQIRWVKTLAFELIKRGFTIGMFTFDSYQSTDIIQSFEHHGIPSEKLSADKTDDVWKNLKDVASDSRLHMPFQQLLMNELAALSRIDGKIDHPPGGSKDLADAFACSIQTAILVGGEEDEEGLETEVGEEFFNMGNLMAMPFGHDEYEGYNGGLMSLPIGLEGVNFHGRGI
jgi:hypothetical protein